MNETQIQADYTAFCEENDVILDEGSDGQGTPESLVNANFVVNFFQNVWKQPITKKNLDAAKHVLLPHLKTFTPQHREYAKLPSQDRSAFAEWRKSSGLSDTMQNANAILGWLKAHNLTATKDHFQLAVGQQRVQHFLEWEQNPSQFKPSRHSETDDGKDFLDSGDMVKILDKHGKVIGLRSKNHADYEKERREREALNQPQPELSSEEQRWRELANSQLSYGNTHSQQKQIRDVFDECRAKNLSWRQTYETCAKLIQQMKRHNEAAILIR